MKYRLLINKDEIKHALIYPLARRLIRAIQSENAPKPTCWDNTFTYIGARSWRTPNGNICHAPLQIEINTYTENPTANHDAPYVHGMRYICGAAKGTCSQHLAAGKCQDEFMRTTVGAILYPNLYPQKTK